MINNNGLNTCSTVAQIMGVTQAYVRKLLNSAKVDDTIKLRGTKIGKEWRIETQSIYNQLGINNSSTCYERDIYIKELEQQIQFYRVQHELYKNIFNIINTMYTEHI